MRISIILKLISFLKWQSVQCTNYSSCFLVYKMKIYSSFTFLTLNNFYFLTILNYVNEIFLKGLGQTVLSVKCEKDTY